MFLVVFDHLLLSGCFIFHADLFLERRGFRVEFIFVGWVDSGGLK